MNPTHGITFDARARLSDYLDQRRLLSRESLGAGIDKPVLEMIRADVGQWAEATLANNPVPYDRISQPQIEATLLGLVILLRRSYSEFVPELELQVTEAFVRMAFDVYEGAPVTESDSFVFLVPIRISKRTPQYRNDVIPGIPALHYVPPELRAQLMVGLPPLVIDTYRSRDMTGYIVFTPVYGDMFDDGAAKSRRSLIETARTRIDDAVMLAQTKLGAKLIGLGGTLPSLTRYGQALNVDEAILTTGHAGTISLISSYVEEAMNRSTGLTLGVVGLGAIGESIAGYMVDRYQRSAELVLFDLNEQLCHSVTDRLQRRHPDAAVQRSSSLAEVINQSDVIISAITGKIDLDQMASKVDLTGTLIIDDSQPASFEPSQVRRRGGRLIGVIARTGETMERSWYDHGTMADNHDFFGCEAEVAVLAAEYQALRSSGATVDEAFRTIRHIAVRRAATIEDVATIGQLFSKHGVSASSCLVLELDQVVDLREPVPTSRR